MGATCDEAGDATEIGNGGWGVLSVVEPSPSCPWKLFHRSRLRERARAQRCPAAEMALSPTRPPLWPAGRPIGPSQEGRRKDERIHGGLMACRARWRGRGPPRAHVPAERAARDGALSAREGARSGVPSPRARVVRRAASSLRRGRASRVSSLRRLLSRLRPPPCSHRWHRRFTELARHPTNERPIVRSRAGIRVAEGPAARARLRAGPEVPLAAEQGSAVGASIAVSATPPRHTRAMRRVARMSRVGSPSTSSMSARRPGAIRPRILQPERTRRCRRGGDQRVDRRETRGDEELELPVHACAVRRADVGGVRAREERHARGVE